MTMTTLCIVDAIHDLFRSINSPHVHHIPGYARELVSLCSVDANDARIREIFARAIHLSAALRKGEAITILFTLCHIDLRARVDESPAATTYFRAALSECDANPCYAPLRLILERFGHTHAHYEGALQGALPPITPVEAASPQVAPSALEAVPAQLTSPHVPSPPITPVEATSADNEPLSRGVTPILSSLLSEEQLSENDDDDDDNDNETPDEVTSVPQSPSPPPPTKVSPPITPIVVTNIVAVPLESVCVVSDRPRRKRRLVTPMTLCSRCDMYHQRGACLR